MVVAQWIVAHTKPGKERWAAENASRQGFVWYLPMACVRDDPRKGQKVVCLFPRYLFVRIEGSWRPLLSTFGVSGVIMSGERPAILPEKAVESLKAREDAEGYVKLPAVPARRFRAQDRVRVNGGAFTGYTGVCAQDGGAQRVRVLLDYLGRKTPVLIGNEHLDFCDDV